MLRARSTILTGSPISSTKVEERGWALDSPAREPEGVGTRSAARMISCTASGMVMK